MRWIHAIYLIFSVVIAFLIAYSMLNNMLDYCVESAPYYLDMVLKCMKYFLLYVVINIVYIIIMLIRNYK